MYRPTDPETPREAADGVQRRRHAELVLQVLRLAPLTHAELSRVLRLWMSGSSARGRCAELVAAGKVRWAGYFKRRDGRRHRVWEAVG